MKIMTIEDILDYTSGGALAPLAEGIKKTKEFISETKYDSSHFKESYHVLTPEDSNNAAYGNCEISHMIVPVEVGLEMVTSQDYLHFGLCEIEPGEEPLREYRAKIFKEAKQNGFTNFQEITFNNLNQEAMKGIMNSDKINIITHAHEPLVAIAPVDEKLINKIKKYTM